MTNPLPAATGQAAPDPELRLRNLTSRHVAIQRTPGGPPLTLPPCGETRLRSSELIRYQYTAWCEAGLLRLDPILIVRPRRGLWLVGLTATLLVLTVIPAALLVYAGWAAGSPPPAWLANSLAGVAGLFALALVIEIAVFGFLHRSVNVALAVITKTVSIAVIVLLALAIPFFAMSLSWDYGKVLRSDQDAATAVFLLLLEIAIVLFGAAAPAGLYFLFTRQRLDWLRQDFLRAVLLLDPNLRTLDEAETKYGGLLEEVYGPPQALGLHPSVGMPLVLCTVLLALGWTLTVLPASGGYLSPGIAAFLHTTRAQALMFAFLGAYFFAINMAFRRYLRADLSPKAYSQISVRLIGALLLVLALTAMPPFASASADSQTAHVLEVLAFLVGIVPETGLALLNDFLTRRGLAAKAVGLQEQYPVTVLEGVSLYDSARLLEEGIENVENLAHAKLIELILRTRIPTSRLVDLFDQAILYLHLCKGTEKVDVLTAHLREFGIRTATDFERAEEAARARHEDGALVRILGVNTYDDSPGAQKVPRLQVMRDAWQDDEWMPYLREWRRSIQSDRMPLTSPEGYQPEQPYVPPKAGKGNGRPAAAGARRASDNG